MKLGDKTLKIFFPGEHREMPKAYRKILSAQKWEDAESDIFRLGWSDNLTKYEEEGTSATRFWTAFEFYVLKSLDKIENFEEGDRERIVRAVFEAERN